MTRKPKIASATSLALVAMLALPGIGTAQTAPSGRTVVTAPLQDLAASDTFGERVQQLWTDMLGLFGMGLGSSGFMRSHNAAAQRQAQMRDDFAWLMDIAGFKLKEIESSVGIIPTLGLTFGQARELTEADRDYVERQLERHARLHGGPLAVVQRTIVRAVLDASELGSFSVDKVEVDFFPLPSVKFVLAPSDAPLGIESARIMRAIDRLNARIQTMSPSQQGFGITPPLSPPRVRPASL
ncbi:hypothetical protein ACQW02_10460 [Humitalea sp. 24SJ18S-53]|uniref:hypothetical protein n=1 Tax=Humitalea sp. 24SJ18S-53 TaxID=3422307 RepID=UPI003D66E1EF